MINPLTRLTRLIIHNWAWKLLSVLIAVAVWILVASEPELSTFATARIEFKNLTDNLELASTPETTILLELRGPSGELGGLSESGRRPAVILDMAGITPGEHTFAIGPKNVNVPRGVRIVRATPSQVRFDLDRPLTREVPVSVRFSGEGRNGYHVASFSIDPENLELVGPRKRVIAIGSVLTDPIDVSSATGFMKVKVNTYVLDPFVRFASTPQATVSITMRK
jgi:YbbR domain-containing protein